MTRPVPFAPFLLLLSLVACGPSVSSPSSLNTPQSPRQGGPTAPITLSFIATNDLHGHIRSLPALSAHVQLVRHQRSLDGGGVVLLDAGDLFQGTLETNFSEGAAVIELYNLLGYDAAALGNHEFDYGQQAPAGSSPLEPTPLGAHPQAALKRRLAQAQFPFLSANLVDLRTGQLPDWPGLAPSVVLTRAGLRIGIIGAITSEASHVVKAHLLAGLQVGIPSVAIAAEAQRLRSTGVDLVVVLFHGGGECADFKTPRDLSSCDLDGELFELVRQLPAGLVDIVFGGHKHKGVAHFVGKTAVAQAYWAGEAFSRVDVSFDRSRPPGTVAVTTHIHEPQRLCRKSHIEPCQALASDGTALPPLESVRQRADEWVARVKLFGDQPLGARCEATLRRSSDTESALGNLFADLMRGAVSGSDVALANAGSVRADLPEGQLTFGDVYEAMPFDNRFATARLSVGELRQLLRRHATHQEHGPLALSGLRAAARCEHEQVVVRLWHPDGAELSDDQVLGVVTSDFIASGGDDLLPPALHSRFRVLSDAPVRDALIQGLQQRGAVGSADKELHDPSRPRLWLDGDLSKCGGSVKREPPNGTKSPAAP